MSSDIAGNNICTRRREKVFLVSLNHRSVAHLKKKGKGICATDCPTVYFFSAARPRGFSIDQEDMSRGRLSYAACAIASFCGLVFVMSSVTLFGGQGPLEPQSTAKATQPSTTVPKAKESLMILEGHDQTTNSSLSEGGTEGKKSHHHDEQITSKAKQS